MNKITLTLLLMFCLCFSNTKAQSTDSKNAPYESLDSIISNLYSSISGDKTKVRNLEFFKSLFHKDARLIFNKYDNGKPKLVFVTPEEYLNRVSEYFKKNDFFEREVYRKVDSFGSMTQVFSTYESSESDDKKVKPFARGINSIQLLNDGKRWWVVNLYWTGENLPIPKEYLPK